MEAGSAADRIVGELRAWIGTVAPGTQVPPSRELAARYGAGPVTVQKAMSTLVGLGLVESRPGAGSFVRGTRTARPLDFNWQAGALRAHQPRLPTVSTPLRDVTDDMIGLHSGYPARELLPERAVRAALTRAARGEESIRRAPAAGLPELQSWFAQELGRSTPSGITPVSPRDVIIVPGTQSGLSSIFRALAGPGQPVVMESPTYWGAILAARQAGVQIVPVSGDRDGPDPDDLARAFAESGARIFYAQPSFANPTGARWSAERRNRVVQTVRDHAAFLIEDDWAADFGIEAQSVPLAAQDDRGHIVYLRSLTKSVSPTIRVGAVIARGPVRDRILADRGAESMYVSGVLQAAALDVVLQPSWRGHLRDLSRQLQQRRDLLADSVRRYVPDADLGELPQGGLNLWVRLPDDIDLGRLVRDCETDGVLVAAGTDWFPAEPAGVFVRLNFAGPDPSRFPDGARVLGEAVRRQRR